MKRSTSLCAYDASFAAGLLEAATEVACTGDDYLLVVHDSAYPHPLGTARPILDNMAIALVLSAKPAANALAKLEVGLGTNDALSAAPPSLANLQSGTPSGRALPLLQAVATGQEASLALEYLAPQGLHVGVTPCR
jgi:hypothetical protein